MSDDSIDDAIGTFRATMAAHGQPLAPKVVKAAKPKGPPRKRGKFWTNILNGMEYRWDSKKKLWVHTGKRGIGMFD